MSNADTSHSVLRYAKRFLAGTLLSRLSGAIRDIAMAVCFGSKPEIGAFMVAYRLANLFRRLFGEGSLQSGFVPHFSSFQGKDSFLFYRDCSFSLLIFLLFFVLIAEGFLWSLSLVVPQDWSEILFLCMRMLPGLIFICLFALNSALLQAQKKYFLSGFAPVLFNGSWVMIAWFVRTLPLAEAMQFLSLGVAFAFFLQWVATALQVGQSIPLSWGEWFRPRLFSSDWKKMLKPMSFGVIGLGATQMNSALDAIFSRIADLSGPAYLWYAIRIEQLPLALFGVALSGALLPPLSRAVSEGAMDRYAVLLEKALRHSAVLLIPCTFGLFSLGRSGLSLLYGHGDFSSADVEQTLYCLWGYGIGLFPSVVILLLAAGFYAQKSYTIPMLASIGSVCFHIVLNLFLVFGLHLGAFSIALSTSLAAFMNCLILAKFVRVHLNVRVFSQGGSFLGRLTVCSLFSALLAMVFEPREIEASSILFQSVLLIGRGLLFAASFSALAYAMQIQELFDFFKKERATP